MDHPAKIPARPDPIPFRTRAAGFTLLEVLVALAVVAVALAALIKVASNNVQNAIYLRDKTLAHWVAMNKITEYHVNREWLPVGERSGSSEMAEREWFWSILTATTEDSSTRRIEVSVRADEDQEDPLVVRVAFLPQPQ